MVRKAITTLGGLCALGLLAVGSHGADPATSQREAGAQSAQGQKQVCLASERIGQQVQTESKEKIGTLKDLVIDQHGQVKYLAVAMQEGAEPQAGAQRTPGAQPQQPQQPGRPQQPGAAAAAAGELVLIPFSLVKMEEPAASRATASAEETITVKIDKADLAQAPKFSTQQLKSAGQAQWMAQVDQFFRSHAGASARPELGEDAQRPGAQPNRQQQPQRPQTNPNRD